MLLIVGIIAFIAMIYIMNRLYIHATEEAQKNNTESTQTIELDKDVDISGKVFCKNCKYLKPSAAGSTYRSLPTLPRCDHPDAFSYKGSDVISGEPIVVRRERNDIYNIWNSQCDCKRFVQK